MSIKSIVRPIPGVRELSILRQRLAFKGSSAYWEANYRQGETSGPGSYGMLGRSKAEYLNYFVCQRSVSSVIEFGCGDGNQLSMAEYPSYIGLDVSKTAITLCKERFEGDSTKSFFLYDGDAFQDRHGVFTADMAMSLDVIYHLIEDSIYQRYMSLLFAAGRKYTVVYSSNTEMLDTAPHVRHRRFTEWVRENCPEWRLLTMSEGSGTHAGRADFFVYEKVPDLPNDIPG